MEPLKPLKSSRTLKERLGLGKVRRASASELARADPEPASPLLFPGTASGGGGGGSSSSRAATHEASAPAEAPQQQQQQQQQQQLVPPQPPAASRELEALRAERAALEDENAGLQAALAQSRGAVSALQSAVSALRSRADVADESKGATSRVLLDLTEKAGQLAAEKVMPPCARRTAASCSAAVVPSLLTPIVYFRLKYSCPLPLTHTPHCPGRAVPGAAGPDGGDRLPGCLCRRRCPRGGRNAGEQAAAG